MKALRMLFVACLGALFLVMGMTGSTAASAPVASCVAYPPNGGPTLSVSTTKPFPGQTITVAGSNFAPNVALTLTLNSTPVVLGHVTTDAGGSFSTHVTIPADVTGTHSISTSAGANTAGCPLDPITIQLATVTTSSGGHSLASTGVDILTGVAIALALICGGLVITRGGRRQSRGAHSANR